MEIDYKVKLDIFEGPLDLLLYLIKKDEIDICDISLERITSQYLEYLQAFKELNIELAGVFVFMSANLIQLISRRFLASVLAFRRRSMRFCSALRPAAGFVFLICSELWLRVSK